MLRFKQLIFLMILLSLSPIFASTMIISIDNLKLKKTSRGIIPEIKGFQLNGIGKKPILPYKNYDFMSKVTKVEILKTQKIHLNEKIALGHNLYTIFPTNTKKLKLLPETLRIPSLKHFYQIKLLKKFGKNKVYRFVFNPVIIQSDGDILFIKKIRLHFADLLPKVKTYYKGSIKKTLLILTTNAIIAHSKELSNFVATKKANGFDVKIATETDFGGANLSGTDKVLKIREWLKSQVGKYDFLLIIADPQPNASGIPMLLVKPAYGTNQIQQPEYQPVYTDMIYATVEGNWDSNGDGIFGTNLDSEVSFAYDFIVGRIPVYNSNYTKLDKILKRTNDYINTNDNVAFRKRILFPASIAFYAKQNNQTQMPKMDGGYVAKYFKDNILPETFQEQVLVEKEGLDPSEFSEYPPLTLANLIDEWNKGYGVVYWIGHGMPTGAYRTIWQHDNGNDGIPTDYELRSTPFITSIDSSNLTEQKAAFVFEGSCLNGQVTKSNNLGYSILLNNAVGVVASSQITFGAVYKNYNPAQSPDVFAYGVSFSKAVVENKYPAKAMMDAKESFYNGDIYPMIKMELNYFGDPSLSLGIKPCKTNSDCDDHLFCNGTETCDTNSGICQKGEPVKCEGSDGCNDSFCDEKTKTCVSEAKADGTACLGEEETSCFIKFECKSGKCTGTEKKDCSSFDSECTKGECDLTTGKCKASPTNEGQSCNKDLFCLVDSVCKNGTCTGKEKDCGKAPACQMIVCDESSKKCISSKNIELNSTPCKTKEGKDGTCDYGECIPNPETHNKKSGGCSLIIF